MHALNASPANWPTLIQDHALALLRSGEYSTFPALMARVLEDVREDTEAARSQEGKDGKDGVMAGKGEGGRSLALPKNVVEEGVKITKECLDLVVEVE